MHRLVCASHSGEMCHVCPSPQMHIPQLPGAQHHVTHVLGRMSAVSRVPMEPPVRRASGYSKCKGKACEGDLGSEHTMGM